MLEAPNSTLTRPAPPGPAGKPARPGHARRAAAWLLAGDRRVWIGAAALGIPLAIVMLVWCLVPRAYYTGTNSVEDYTYIAQVNPGVRTCVPALQLPAGTGGVRVRLISRTDTRPWLHMTLYEPGRTVTSNLPPKYVGPDRISTAVFPIPITPSRPGTQPASLCLTGDDMVNWGGTPAPQGPPPPTVGGAPIQGRLAIWYTPPPGAKRSYLSEVGSIFQRAALFRPGIVGAWTYWLALFAVIPALAVLAVRTLAIAVRGRARRLALWVFAIAAVNFACWALITPAFQGPDEPDHFAYTQSLVERGQAPSRDPGSPLPRWSSAEARALDGTKFTGSHQVGDSRAPWLPADQRAYQASTHTLPNRRDDGGGNETAATHGPLYYLALAPAYAATRGSSTFSQLTAMRLLSALIAALTAVFTFLLGRELAPNRPWLGVLAALLVCFEPMFGFVSGIVNNDVGVNAGAAGLELLLILLLRRGLDWRWGALTGAVLILLPIVKGTGLALYPAAAVVLLLSLLRHHSRRNLIGLAAFAATALVVQELSVHLAGVLHPSAGNSPGVGSSVSASTAALHNIRGYLSYLYEALVPRRLWFTTPHFQGTANPDYVIFIERGFGAFGWYDLFWAQWVYTVIWITVVLTPFAAIYAAWRERAWVRRHWPECAAVILFPVAVIAGFEAAFYTPTSRALIGEFGRYAFPAIGPLALLAVGALHAFGRRRMVFAGAALLAAMIVLSISGQLVTLTGFYA